MKKILVQSINIGGQPIEGPLKLPGLSSNEITLGHIVSRILSSFILPIAGIILLFVLVSGGFDYMMSQGDANKIKSAQAKITTALIGFGLLIFSFLLTKLISLIFGIQTGII